MHHNVKATDQYKTVLGLKDDPFGKLLKMGDDQINDFVDKQDPQALLKYLTRLIVHIAKRHLK